MLTPFLRHRGTMKTTIAARIALLSLLAAGGCETAPTRLTLLGAERCGDPRPPTTLLPLDPGDVRRTDFFSAHPLPHLTNAGGPILKNPRLIAAFFGEDPDREETEAFLQSYGCSAAFRDQVSEYGIGDASYERSVVLPDPPEFHGFGDIGEWVFAQKAELGPLPDDALPILFAPASFRIPDACDTMYGLHMEAAGAFPFALIFDCPGRYSQSDRIETRAYITSHEILEAATNPFPLLHPAWVGLDQPWGAPSAGEVADLCMSAQGPVPDYPIGVSPGWSNRLAQAGYDPCGSAPAPFQAALPRSRVLGVVNGIAMLDVDVFSDDPAAEYSVSIATTGCADIVPVSPSDHLHGGDTHSAKIQRDSNCADPVRTTQISIALLDKNSALKFLSYAWVPL